jgi:hypothetical protein
MNHVKTLECDKVKNRTKLLILLSKEMAFLLLVPGEVWVCNFGMGDGLCALLNCKQNC